jgi:ABC-type uncharacterized transport system auxiliary subunit
MSRPMLPSRRALLLGTPALTLAGCSVLPDRPYQEVRRFALAPERPGQQVALPGAPVLLLRTFRAAPGLDARGLRSLGADGQVAQAYWQEWAAPPAELAEEATRRWLTASGLFAAVTAPGSRLRANLVLEGELIRLQAEPAAGRARAALAVLLLAESEAAPTRILAQLQPEAAAPLAGSDGAAAAAAMAAALAGTLAALEAALPGLLSRRA